MSTQNSEATTEPQHEVQGRFFLNVVVRKRPAILELLACKDQPLLVRRNAFLILDLSFDIVDRIRGLNIEGDSLAREGLDKDLHATTEPQHEVQRRFLLNVVIRKRPAILKLLACEDQPLLVRRNAFLVLDLSLHIVDRVRGLDIEGDRLARESLDKDLHATTEPKDQMQIFVKTLTGKTITLDVE